MVVFEGAVDAALTQLNRLVFSSHELTISMGFENGSLASVVLTASGIALVASLTLSLVWMAIAGCISLFSSSGEGEEKRVEKGQYEGKRQHQREKGSEEGVREASSGRRSPLEREERRMREEGKGEKEKERGREIQKEGEENEERERKDEQEKRHFAARINRESENGGKIEPQSSVCVTRVKKVVKRRKDGSAAKPEKEGGVSSRSRMRNLDMPKPDTSTPSHLRTQPLLDFVLACLAQPKPVVCECCKKEVKQKGRMEASSHAQRLADSFDMSAPFAVLDVPSMLESMGEICDEVGQCVWDLSGCPLHIGVVLCCAWSAAKGEDMTARIRVRGVTTQLLHVLRDVLNALPNVRVVLHLSAAFTLRRSATLRSLLALPGVTVMVEVESTTQYLTASAIVGGENAEKEKLKEEEEKEGGEEGEERGRGEVSWAIRCNSEKRLQSLSKSMRKYLSKPLSFRTCIVEHCRDSLFWRVLRKLTCARRSVLDNRVKYRIHSSSWDSGEFGSLSDHVVSLFEMWSESLTYAGQVIDSTSSTTKVWIGRSLPTSHEVMFTCQGSEVKGKVDDHDSSVVVVPTSKLSGVQCKPGAFLSCHLSSHLSSHLSTMVMAGWHMGSSNPGTTLLLCNQPYLYNAGQSVKKGSIFKVE
uniref:Uncharacterized protein n=1 Tax=Palpitomonas bilix TaxID=652834 RepID=A0A7S3LTI2_9EUKA|mmetsp:Transcript_4499/g.9280  ORF Transcript_4499/g.9280 Transcript_4499/m.9280 type:complete len:644 (+) Transcript_4499:31-1962(+)